MPALSEQLPFPTCHCPRCDPHNGRAAIRLIETITVKGEYL